MLGITEREFFDQMGVHFVGFVSQYGYDRVLSVLGRHMRDFLNGGYSALEIIDVLFFSVSFVITFVASFQTWCLVHVINLVELISYFFLYEVRFSQILLTVEYHIIGKQNGNNSKYR